VIIDDVPSLTSLKAKTTVDLDQFAWRVICGWPDHSMVEVVHEGLDYGELTRYFLWDKVPRAVRYQVNPKGFALEQALLNQIRQQQARMSTCRSQYPRWKRQIKQPFQSLGWFASVLRLRLSHYSRPAPILFIPRQHFHLRSTLTALLNNPAMQLVAPLEHGFNTGVHLFRTLPKQPPDVTFAQQLHQGIIRGLKAFDITLFETDQQKLQQQILQQISLVRQIEAEFAIAAPQAILVFADNHSPLQEYVAIARRQGIPTIMLQHGLDCEQYCLSEAYASVIAVWGKSRQQRYQKVSNRKPVLIQVTGNPEYDHFRLPEQLCEGGDHWLWVTRPHGPEKCYLPSRTPQEGLEILKAILLALKQTESARLMIKPHPLDYADLYQVEVEKCQLSHRVAITHEPLATLLPHANIVISEDSTAALEAMFFGKIVIHAHFASSPPILPLIEYAAALPADSPEMLHASLRVAKTLTTSAKTSMLRGQHNFIGDYAGPLDGQACQRVTTLITEVMSGTVCS
jgi:hypothetical protein